MWSGGVVFQRGRAREYPRFWPRDGARRAELLRARIPWLAALETERDNVHTRGAHAAVQPRGAEEQVEFERLFSQHAAALRDYLYGLTRNHEAATDLMQETFLRAWASTTPPAEIQRPKAWLYRIATNLALNQSRRQRRFVWLSLETVELLGAAGSSDRWRTPPLASHLRSAEDVAASVVERDAIWETLAALPPRQQAALLLQTSGGFEPREIAILLSLSETNVRKMLFRAKERFRTVYRAMNAEMNAEMNADETRGHS